jgi:membrane associated rhomboid family serine protease
MLPLSDNIRSRTTPVVTLGIIITCVLVFILQLVNPQLANEWAFKPAYLLSAQFWHVGPIVAAQSLLLSIFLHGGLLHIGGNMLFLWVFGDNVEDRMGHLRFLVFYLVCGAFATLVHSLSAVLGLLHDPHALELGVIGASGAIAGILGAYLVLTPHASVRTLIFIIFFITIVNIPAPFFILFWFVMQLFSGVGALAGAGGNVAYWAHIGGFVLGFVWAQRVGGGRRRGLPNPNPRVLNIDVGDV